MLEMLRKRRSIRKFEERPVEQDRLELLLESLLRAPTSRGRQPWAFILVQDPQDLSALSEAKAHGAGFLADTPVAIAICADPEVSDVWIEDCSIAAITLQYSAEKLGLASCWVQLRLRENKDGEDAEAVARKILQLPERFRVPCIIGLGYPAQSLPGHPREELPWNKLHDGHFGSPLSGEEPA